MKSDAHSTRKRKNSRYCQVFNPENLLTEPLIYVIARFYLSILAQNLFWKIFLRCFWVIARKIEAQPVYSLALLMQTRYDVRLSSDLFKPYLFFIAN